MKLVEEYKRQWAFFKEHIFKLSAILFIAFVVMAIVSHFIFAQLLNTNPALVNEVVSFIREYSKGFDFNEGALTIILKLFFNNGRATLLMISMGVVPFLFLPVVLFGSNALLIGVITGFSQHFGMSLSLMLASLLPHCIIEIPAIAISAALGIYLCNFTIKFIRGKGDKPFSAGILEVLKSYVLVILPMLAIAAIIEGAITPLVAGLFM